MERLVTVKFPSQGNGRTYPYKTFFDVKSGDYVIVKTAFSGYAVAKVVCSDVPPNMHIVGSSRDLDYLVQPINPLAYEHYKEKDANLRKAKEIIRGLSADELEELAQIIVQRYPGN